MKRHIFLQLLLITGILFSGCSGNSKKVVSDNDVKLVQNEAEQRVDIFVDGKLFTSFLYTDTIPNLTKPVLFPVIAADGSVVTRGFPLEPRPNERTDHPHHIGMWFTYGDVNHIDFWGNSAAMPPEMHDKLGWIRNISIIESVSGKGKGELRYTADWLNASGHALLSEDTRLIFRADSVSRTIDRITTLTAREDTVTFFDTKEGMMGIRVTRALELPSDKPVVLSDEHGNKTEVAKMDNTGVTGDYLNSEGITGYDVWGKRAVWVALTGKINNDDIAVVIFDHPGNPGYPAYWHARGYGLFAVNPLGQKTFSKGKEELNFSIPPGGQAVFKYRVLMINKHPEPDFLNKIFQDFSSF